MHLLECTALVYMKTTMKNEMEVNTDAFTGMDYVGLYENHYEE